MVKPSTFYVMNKFKTSALPWLMKFSEEGKFNQQIE